MPAARNARRARLGGRKAVGGGGKAAARRRPSRRLAVGHSRRRKGSAAAQASSAAAPDLAWSARRRGRTGSAAAGETLLRLWLWPAPYRPGRTSAAAGRWRAGGLGLRSAAVRSKSCRWRPRGAVRPCRSVYFQCGSDIDTKSGNKPLTGCRRGAALRRRRVPRDPAAGLHQAGDAKPGRLASPRGRTRSGPAPRRCLSRMPGVRTSWPASCTTISALPGQAFASSLAVSIGEPRSKRPWISTPGMPASL